MRHSANCACTLKDLLICHKENKKGGREGGKVGRKEGDLLLSMSDCDAMYGVVSGCLECPPLLKPSTICVNGWSGLRELGYWFFTIIMFAVQKWSGKVKSYLIWNRPIVLHSLLYIRDPSSIAINPQFLMCQFKIPKALKIHLAAKLDSPGIHSYHIH